MFGDINTSIFISPIKEERSQNELNRVINELETLQNKVNEIKKSGMIEKVLEDGANKARYLARKKLSKVYRKIGIN